ncbi:unnamed protein product [Ectocarpus sp. 12 AP-2014]
MPLNSSERFVSTRREQAPVASPKVCLTRFLLCCTLGRTGASLCLRGVPRLEHTINIVSCVLQISSTPPPHRSRQLWEAFFPTLLSMSFAILLLALKIRLEEFPLRHKAAAAGASVVVGNTPGDGIRMTNTSSDAQPLMSSW